MNKYDIEETYTRVKDIWKKNLEEYGVELPNLTVRNAGKIYTSEALWLVYLYPHVRKNVLKEDIAKFVIEHKPDAKGDQQVRHLKEKGFDLRCSGRAKDKDDEGNRIPQGYYQLVSLTKPHIEFLKQLNKREATSGDFEENWISICATFKNRCAHCGSKSPLEKGHINPNKQLKKGNILPLCVRCNNWALDYIFFGPDGRIKKIAPSGLVLFYKKLSSREKQQFKGLLKDT